ncbi:ABC transporter permease [Alkalicella caledoniensis]|uniref:ABC transporter permease n=1 Tax=Alkalicella caledoniensis TaxID=2731377 RepID=A0A7G9W9D0_ALKCA|nr:ABC transporter permease [Alkalicella caledoniensis]QNO15292.1 ABC transporter permease [Alkalicella caledoniensis]
MKSLNQVGIRYLKEQKKRTILTIMGIIISVAMITSIGTMMYSMERYEYKSTVERNGYNHGAYVDITNEQYSYLKNNVNFEELAEAKLAGTSFTKDASDKTKRIELMGYEKRYLELRSMLPVEGRLPENKNEVVLERWKANLLGIEIGDKVTLPVGHFKRGNKILQRNEWDENATFHEIIVHDFNLVGIIESNGSSQSYANSRAIVDLAWAEDVNDTGLSTAVFRVKKGLDIIKTTEDVAKELDIDENNIQYNFNLINREQGGIQPTLLVIATFLIGLVCVATVAVIYNSFHISVLERVKQFGIMRSIGTTPRQVRVLVFTEAGILSIISIPFGLAAGYYATKLLFYLLSMGEYSSFQNMQIMTSKEVLGGSAVIALISVYLSALSPALSAGRVSPLNAIFQHRTLKKERNTKSGFLIGKVFGSEGMLAYKNLQRNRKRLVITAFSLSISVIMFIVFSVFSFYALRINDNLFGYSADFAMYTRHGSSQPFTLEEIAKLEAIEGVAEVLPYAYSNFITSIEPDKIMPNIKESFPWVVENGFIYGSIQGYRNEDLHLLREELISGEVDVDKINKELGVFLIYNSEHYDHENRRTTIAPTFDLEVGSIIYLDTENEYVGEDTEIDFDNAIPVKVMGLVEKSSIGYRYPSMGLMGIITTYEVYEQITGDSGFGTVYVNIEEDADYETVVAGLNSVLENKGDAGIQDSIANNRRDRQTVLELSVLIYGFITLISLIGALNIINTISTNLITRTKEFGMLRAVGMTPKGMRKMIRLEAIFSSITGTIFGLIVGNLLGYYLYTLLNDYEGYPWEFPLNANIIAIVATVIIALFAAVAPLKKIASMNIMEILREE